MKSSSIIIAILLTFNLKLFSQNINNSLNKAQEFYAKKQYQQAESLLSEEIQKGSNSPYIYWLYGQIMHEKGQKKMSKVLFEKAIMLDPENNELKLNYYRSLFYSGQIEQAENYLEQFVASDIDEASKAEAYLMLGYINYWHQDKKNAEKYTNNVLAINPNDNTAKELNKKIAELSGSYLNVNFDYGKDDQPLKSFSGFVEAGMRKNNLFNPKIQIINHNFNTNENTLSVNLGNDFFFPKSGFSASIIAGVFKNFSQDFEFTGELKVKQKIINNVIVSGGINHLPYLNTAISTKQSLMENNLFGNIEYQNPKIVDINILYQYKFFNDNNYINTFGGWIISRPLTIDIFKIKAGYGYSYADSKEIAYYPEQPLTSYPLWSEMPGEYNPYFTPKEQEIHSVVGIITATITPKLVLDLSGSYGFSAKNLSPLLYNNMEGEQGFLAFYKQKYHPYNIKANVNYTLSNKMNIGVYYEHQETSFYKQDKAGAKLSYTF